MRVSLLALLAGCPHRPAPVPSLPAAALFRPGRYDYVELESHAGLPPVRTTVTETWSRAPDLAPPPALGGEVWRVDNYSLVPDGPDPARVRPALVGTTRYAMGPSGLAHFAFQRGDALRTYAPKIALPPEVGPGVTWSGTHGEGADANTQSCGVEPTPFCGEGVAVACETRWSDRAVWMRHHWCAGVGWVGYEAVRVANGTSTVSWSEEVTRDGEQLPTVGIERRPVPEAVIRRASE